MAIYFGKTLDEKLAIADEYYGATSHLQTHGWSLETENDRKAALTQAEREANLYLGIDLETSFSNTSFPIDACPNKRPDYAIFEHAWFLLDNTARVTDGEDGAQDIESEEYQQQEKTSGVVFSPQAARFFGLNRLQTSKG